MYECFVSSRLAAEAIVAGRLEDYPATLDAALARLHGASWKLKRALDRWPRASWRIARTQLLWRSVERLLLGDVAAPADVRGPARIPLRLLDALARLP
jgi:hypothetical protein